VIDLKIGDSGDDNLIIDMAVEQCIEAGALQDTRQPYY
jgi:hypothetical protein